MRLARRDDSGAVAILVAVLATVLFAFAAIVVDLGYARTVEGDAQNAVDASSLAGAGILATDVSPSAFANAYRAIKASASANFGTTAADWSACVATPPGASWVQEGSGTNCIMFNHAVNPTKVQVVLPSKHVDSFFGGLVGYGGMDISAAAQATVREEDVPGCALCVQGTLDTSGSVEVRAGSPGGPVGSSSASNGVVQTGGSITVEDPGAITFENTPVPAKGPMYSTRPIIRPVTDPFAGDPMPSGPGGVPLGAFPGPASSGRVTCGDGDVLTENTYRNITVTASISDPCIATGVIVVTGRLQVVSGGYLSDGYLSGGSSVIQLSCGRRRVAVVCAPGTPGGRLQIDDGGHVVMGATPLFPTEFSVVADPNNTSTMTIDGELSVDGAIYGASTPVQVGAFGANAVVSASGRISVAQMTIGSNSAVTVTAAGGAPVPGPPFVGLYR